MTRAAIGRPTKFTEETRKKVLWALRLGNYRKTAAEYAGISERTLGDWLYKGSEEKSGDYADFHQEVLEAEQAAEVRALGVIQQAAQKGEWKAAAWFLERKFPARYCTRAAIMVAKRLQVDGEPDLAGMDDDELDAMILESIGGITTSIPKEKLLSAIERDGEILDASADDTPSALRVVE